MQNGCPTNRLLPTMGVQRIRFPAFRAPGFGGRSRTLYPAASECAGALEALYAFVRESGIINIISRNSAWRPRDRPLTPTVRSSRYTGEAIEAAQPQSRDNAINFQLPTFLHVCCHHLPPPQHTVSRCRWPEANKSCFFSCFCLPPTHIFSIRQRS